MYYLEKSDDVAFKLFSHLCASMALLPRTMVSLGKCWYLIISIGIHWYPLLSIIKMDKHLRSQSQLLRASTPVSRAAS